MIRREVKKEIYLTKKERLMFQGGNFFILRRKSFLYLLTNEEFESINSKINNNFSGKAKRDVCRLFFSRIQESSSEKRKIRIQSYLL